ncbi:cytochrome c biogenesis CcdA family protein [Fictibacillus fluitans]|uniref:Cytochrome c biogenesis protein CcdA n=1 Tax=Fictibacillus fluitans TaxID=3058422 RepID=A0ABT8I0A2_9BACL|nr:cytochrome c biogenesis protein CcdA [Fictibacillus sp. NE201]MDN4526452.1 cytochrome c biogenesis protein CcdA [Fictibacillus sp. NE201]
MQNVTLLLAFSGGLLAFISPCCLPLYPSFLSYITGMSVQQLKSDQSLTFKRKILLHSLFFSIGFSIIYYALGFSVSKIGELFINYQDLIRMVGGVFIVAMGLFLVGIIKPKFLFKEFRFKARGKNSNYLNSLLVGLIFAAGWTPCIGPIFSAIMYANVLNPAKTFMNITAYSLGFCIPFIIMAFFITKTKFIIKYSSQLMRFGGGIMVVLGVMLYFNKMIYFNIWGTEFQYYITNLFN